jgi:hypothetical protein
VRQTAHPPIHNHGFHLHSFVLAGEYREALFQVAPVALRNSCDPRFAKRKPLNVYLVRSNGQNNEDIVELSQEEMLAVSEAGVESYPAGVSHSLPIGVYHATLIPKNSYCVTIAVMGPRRANFVDRLLGRMQFDPTERSRQLISPKDSALMINELFKDPNIEREDPKNADGDRLDTGSSTKPE